MATAWPPTASSAIPWRSHRPERAARQRPANVILASGYDAEGHRVSLSANIGGTLAGNGTVTGGIKDFINAYTFNTRGDMTGITQTAQTGGSDNGVAAKNVVLGYNNNGQIGSIAAYASTGTGGQVYSATDSYDADLRLTDLVYSAAGSTIAGYHLDYNSNSTVADEYVRNDTTGTPGGSFPELGRSQPTPSTQNATAEYELLVQLRQPAVRQRRQRRQRHAELRCQRQPHQRVGSSLSPPATPARATACSSTAPTPMLTMPPAIAS